MIGHAPDRQLLGPSPSPLASCELLRELIGRRLDDVALILRIDLMVKIVVVDLFDFLLQ